jgi:hypothetical protein
VLIDIGIGHPVTASALLTAAPRVIITGGLAQVLGVIQVRTQAARFRSAMIERAERLSRDLVLAGLQAAYGGSTSGGPSEHRETAAQAAAPPETHDLER